MQRYDSYKDSGIQWLGEIPSHWEVAKGKHYLDILYGYPFESELFSSEGFPLIRIRDITSGCIETYYRGTYDDKYVVQKGDLLVGMDGDFNVRLWNKEDALLNQRCCKVNTRGKDLLLRYFYYLLPIPLKEINELTNSTTVKHLGNNDINNIIFGLPPLPEQQAIASYLDTATSKIDEAIAQQQKMIDLLNERKQIIINNAVTKGLNPNAKMKPSGIDWIGNIPEHWEVRKLKQIAKLRSGDTISSDQFTTSGFPVFGGNGFRGYTDRYTNEGNYVLIGRQGALCGNVNYADGKFFATEHAVVVYPHSSENVIWLGECIKASNLNQYSQSAAQPGLAVSVIGNVSYPYPPTEERDSIAEYIRQNTERLYCSINNATKQIALLQERKQIIINDVVTGKVKVFNN